MQSLTHHNSIADSTYSQVATIANQTSQAIARAAIAGAQVRGQQVVERLEQEPAARDVDVLAGTFTWTDGQTHVPHSARFYVRTCADAGSQECQAKRADDYNEQFADQYFALEQAGELHIAYSEIKPNPFF